MHICFDDVYTSDFKTKVSMKITDICTLSLIRMFRWKKWHALSDDFTTTDAAADAAATTATTTAIITTNTSTIIVTVIVFIPGTECDGCMVYYLQGEILVFTCCVNNRERVWCVHSWLITGNIVVGTRSASYRGGYCYGYIICGMTSTHYLTDLLTDRR